MSYARNKRRKTINRRNKARHNEKTKPTEKGASTATENKLPDAKSKRTPRLYLPKR